MVMWDRYESRGVMERNRKKREEAGEVLGPVFDSGYKLMVLKMMC